MPIYYQLTKMLQIFAKSTASKKDNEITNYYYLGIYK